MKKPFMSHHESLFMTHQDNIPWLIPRHKNWPWLQFLFHHSVKQNSHTLCSWFYPLQVLHSYRKYDIQEFRSIVKVVVKVIFRNMYRSLPRSEIFVEFRGKNVQIRGLTFLVIFHRAVNLIAWLVPSAPKNRKIIKMLIFKNFFKIFDSFRIFIKKYFFTKNNRIELSDQLM